MCLGIAWVRVFIFSAVFEPIVGVFRSTSRTAMSAGLVTSVNYSTAPGVCVIGALVRRCFSIASANGPCAGKAIIYVIRFDFRLCPFVFGLFGEGVISGSSFDAYSYVAYIGSLRSSIDTIHVTA